MKKWNRDLNTSKQFQGVSTPPAAHHPNKRKKYFGFRIFHKRPALKPEPIIEVETIVEPITLTWWQKLIGFFQRLRYPLRKVKG